MDNNFLLTHLVKGRKIKDVTFDLAKGEMSIDVDLGADDGGSLCIVLDGINSILLLGFKRNFAGNWMGDTIFHEQVADDTEAN